MRLPNQSARIMRSNYRSAERRAKGQLGLYAARTVKQDHCNRDTLLINQLRAGPTGLHSILLEGGRSPTPVSWWNPFGSDCIPGCICVSPINCPCCDTLITL
jgi:hypothetical protein